MPSTCVFENETDLTCNIVFSELLTGSSLVLGDTLKVQVIVSSQSKGDSSPSLVKDKLIAFAPRAPQNLVSDPDVTSSTQIGLLWEVPTDDQGSAVIDYTVQWRKDENSAW